jgi:hypothetical protein
VSHFTLLQGRNVQNTPDFRAAGSAERPRNEYVRASNNSQGDDRGHRSPEGRAVGLENPVRDRTNCDERIRFCVRNWLLLFNRYWLVFVILFVRAYGIRTACPIAIAASVAMLISMHLAQHQPILAQQDHLIAMMRGHDAYSCVYGNSKTRHVVKQITLWSWIVLLVIAGAYVGLFEGYPLLMLSVFTLAVGTHSYFTMHGANKYARLLYWSITLMICTFALGSLIPRSWYFEYQFSPSALLEYVCPKPSWCSGFASKQMTYSIITLDDDTSVSGQLMHPGDANVLFYQYDGSKASTNGIRLLRRDKIKAIRLCKAEIFAPAGVCLRGM